jgi:hypothetical protein
MASSKDMFSGGDGAVAFRCCGAERTGNEMRYEFKYQSFQPNTL